MGRFVIKDLTGKIFSKLTVLKYAGPNKERKSLWLCRCECGKEIIGLGGNLTAGRLKSCGCYVKHGMSKKRLYTIWESMKGRCLNINNTRYLNYGGRGIKVCEEWVNDFITFKKWALLNGYSDDLTIERKNVDDHYSPENCTWIPMLEQALNKTNTIKIEINGIIMSASEVAEKYNLRIKTVRSRVKKGYSVEKIIAPIKDQYKHQWPD